LLAADLAVDGIHAWGRLYDRLSGELRIKVMERGEVVEKSPGQIRFDSPERSVRQNNFYAADKAGSRSPIVAPMHSTTLRYPADAVPAARPGGPPGSSPAQKPDDARDARDDVVGHHSPQSGAAEVPGGEGPADRRRAVA